jgi:hypothetical protein
MAHYLPPDSVGVSIFNSTQYPSLNDPLTTEAANALYLSKTGGNVLGSLLPLPTLTYDLGSPSQEWGNVICAGLTASVVANAERLLTTGSVGSQNEFFPAFSHSAEPTGGMYFPLNNTIGISANGTESALFESTQVQSAKWKSNAVVGTQNAATPALSHTSDTDTGIYFPLSNVMGISANGVSSATFGVNGFSSTVQPYLYVEHNTEQKIANNTATTALFNTTLTTQGTAITINSGTGVVTVTQAGIYAFFAKVNWKTNAGTGYLREIYFSVSSFSGRRPGTTKVQIDPTLQLTQCANACLRLSANDTITLTVYQNTNLDEFIGATANVALSNELMVIRLA